MKISIITVCYNSADTILSTLDSIALQNYADIEHVIIDGASKDKTLEIINRHAFTEKVVVSEPDNGIYDAMNKGIELVSGDVVGTLNADDYYMNNLVISEVATIFKDLNVDACFADLIYVNKSDTNKIVRYWKSQPYIGGLFKKGWMPAHPTFFVRKSIYEKYGIFNLKYKIAADFELLFRLIEQNKIKTVYVPKIWVKMRTGGTTNASLTNILTQNKEIISTLRQYYADFSVIGFLFRKLTSRLSQYFNRPRYK